jgi:hypothetical protein
MVAGSPILDVGRTVIPRKAHTEVFIKAVAALPLRFGLMRSFWGEELENAPY